MRDKPQEATAIGIDVGGPAKGFHAVALNDGRYLDRARFPAAIDAAAWCKGLGAEVVSVDAPCCWSATGRARAAERNLAAAGIFAYATPTRAVAQSKKFYGWMLNGESLYSHLQTDYQLLDGAGHSRRICFETFPHAAACALAGRILSAKQKCTDRRSVLSQHGVDTSMLSNIDYVDAAICALVGEFVRRGEFETYGDSAGGFICVPIR